MNRPIRIIYLIAESSPYGSNVALLNLLDIIISKGVSPMVVMAGKGLLCEILRERGIPFHQIKYYYSIYPSRKSFKDFIFYLPILARTLLYNYYAVNSLAKLANKFKADLIHTNIGPLNIGYKIAKKLNIPHVWHIREYQDLYFGWHALFSKASFVRKLNSKNNYPISITKGLFEYYSMKNNARIIYDGVMKASKTQFLQKKDKYFLFVGRLEEAKGIEQLLASFIEFANDEKDCKLLIAGNGTETFKSILFKIVKTAGINERIMFLGFRNDINDLMAHAMALVVSSSYEGFGFTTVEAMFNGCLVIGKNSGGTKEILEEKQLGLLYSDEKELVAMMQLIISNGIKSYYSTISKAQMEASKLYSSEKNADEVYDFYQDIMKNNISL